MITYVLAVNGFKAPNKKVYKFIRKKLPKYFVVCFSGYDMTKCCSLENGGVLVKTTKDNKLIDITHYETKFEFLMSMRTLAKEMCPKMNKKYTFIVENRGIRK